MLDSFIFIHSFIFLLLPELRVTVLILMFFHTVARVCRKCGGFGSNLHFATRCSPFGEKATKKSHAHLWIHVSLTVRQRCVISEEV